MPLFASDGAFGPMAAVQVLWNEIQNDWITAAIVGATVACSYAA
jgi:hypothetical protein